MRQCRPRVAEIPYPQDSSRLFEALFGDDRPRSERWSAFLDSGHPWLAQAAGWAGMDESDRVATARYDILAADPWLRLTTRGAWTEIRGADGSRRRSARDPFDLAREWLQPDARHGLSADAEPLPFAGGAIGWFGYDLARRIERLPTRPRERGEPPDLALGLYDWAAVVDHRRRRAWLLSAGRDPRTKVRWSELLARARRPPPERLAMVPLHCTAPVRSNMVWDDYARAFAKVRDYLRAGDCYQVNLAQRFAAPVAGDPWRRYRILRQTSPAPFAAYLEFPCATVLSVSPERFLHVRDGHVETRPIKGTRPRGATPAQDAALRLALLDSLKDRAENLMIVDLLRNDLGRVCEPGTVRVPRLFALESFATVHHLVSTVTGRLGAGEDALSLLRACFPGGSVTGAPKVRAMRIIDELEPRRRGIYCGAIGYLSFDGAMDTGIAIRTLVIRRGQACFWAGGGIVHDSEVAAEYRETYDKAAALFAALEARE